MSNFDEWKEICEGYAKQIGAELLFVNSDSFGICTKEGYLMHIYADELMELLLARQEKHAIEDGDWYE